MSERPRRAWHLYLLAVISVAVIVFAVTSIGPPGSSARVSTETVTAETGVVQSTVSGSGNVEAGIDLDVNFAAGGTLAHVYVKVGQQVKKGQLLATLNPASAQLTLDQAEENLRAAEDQLTSAEDGSSSSGSSSTDAGVRDAAETSTIRSATSQCMRCAASAS
jgi:multidrug efflux pump subunit AcrA (membrane-fusion protein)